MNGTGVDGAPEIGRMKRESLRSIMFIENFPYVLMMLFGVVILLVGLQFSLIAWLSAGLYTICGIAGAFWIIVFVCPYCHNFGVSCPSGHGQLSAKFMTKKDETLFSKKIRKNMPGFVLPFIVPVVAGAIFLIFLPLMLCFF